MSDQMLVVASETLSPLCTDSPVPTDGQQEWWRCCCGRRALEQQPSCPAPHNMMAPDGPFPFTVAAWQETDCPLCYGGKVRTFECADDHEEFLGRCQDCPDSGQVGAVVATVEVAGPSHHADECPDDPRSRCPYLLRQETCETGCYSEPSCITDAPEGGWQPDGACGGGPPDCWHTPVGKVTVLDVPIPCERPTGPVNNRMVKALLDVVKEALPHRESYGGGDLDDALNVFLRLAEGEE